MLIGEVAGQAGLPTQTVRFYERAGLLPVPTRSANGYRVFDASTLNRLAFIRAGQAAGLTLAEIRGVVEVRDAGEVPCAHVTGLLKTRLETITDRMEELEALSAQLRHLLERGRDLDPDDCTEVDTCHVLVDPARRAVTAGSSGDSE